MLDSDCIYPTREDLKKALKQQRSQAAGSYFVLHSHEEDNRKQEENAPDKDSHLTRIRRYEALSRKSYTTVTSKLASASLLRKH